MADRAAAVGTGQETMRALLAYTYFDPPQPRQRRRRKKVKSSPKNFFCVACKVGGLNKRGFVGDGDHADHPSIRVRKVTYEDAVCVDDLRRIMPHAQVNQIQLYKENHRLLCKFYRPAWMNGVEAGPSTSRQGCHGCGFGISPGTTPNFSASPVCSVECALNLAADAEMRMNLDLAERRLDHALIAERRMNQAVEEHRVSAQIFAAIEAFTADEMERLAQAANGIGQ